MRCSSRRKVEVSVAVSAACSRGCSKAPAAQTSALKVQSLLQVWPFLGGYVVKGVHKC